MALFIVDMGSGKDLGYISQATMDREILLARAMERCFQNFTQDFRAAG